MLVPRAREALAQLWLCLRLVLFTCRHRYTQHHPFPYANLPTVYSPGIQGPCSPACHIVATDIYLPSLGTPLKSGLAHDLCWSMRCEQKLHESHLARSFSNLFELCHNLFPFAQLTTSVSPCVLTEGQRSQGQDPQASVRQTTLYGGRLEAACCCSITKPT